MKVCYGSAGIRTVDTLVYIVAMFVVLGAISLCANVYYLVTYLRSAGKPHYTLLSIQAESIFVICIAVPLSLVDLSLNDQCRVKLVLQCVAMLTATKTTLDCSILLFHDHLKRKNSFLFRKLNDKSMHAAVLLVTCFASLLFAVTSLRITMLYAKLFLLLLISIATCLNICSLSAKNKINSFNLRQTAVDRTDVQLPEKLNILVFVRFACILQFVIISLIASTAAKENDRTYHELCMWSRGLMFFHTLVVPFTSNMLALGQLRRNHVLVYNEPNPIAAFDGRIAEMSV